MFDVPVILYFFFLFILSKYSDNKKVTYQNLFSTIIPSSYISNKKYVK